MLLITGGSGFLGEHLIARAVRDGIKVRSLDLNPPVKRLPEVEYVEGDVCDRTAVERTCEDATQIIHNAALVPLSKAGPGFWKTNVEGTQNVLETARKSGCTKLVFISSSSVYGLPSTDSAITESTPLAPFEDYGKSKAAAETLCQEEKKNLDISILRPRTILGPGRVGLMSLLFEWVASGRHVYILGQGKNSYQLVDAEDVVEACFRILSADCRGEDFNVGAARFGALRDDLEKFISSVGSRARILGVPAGLARTVLPVLGGLGLSPFVSYQYHIADRSVYFSVDKMQERLGFAPRWSNAETLERAYRWYLEHREEAAGSSLHRSKLKVGIFKLLRFLP